MEFGSETTIICSFVHIIILIIFGWVKSQTKVSFVHFVIIMIMKFINWPHNICYRKTNKRTNEVLQNVDGKCGNLPYFSFKWVPKLCGWCIRYYWVHYIIFKMCIFDIQINSLPTSAHILNAIIVMYPVFVYPVLVFDSNLIGFKWK